MYLDTLERDEIAKVILSFHVRWFKHALTRYNFGFALRLLFFVILFMVGFALAVALLSDDERRLVSMPLVALCIVGLQVSFYNHRRKMRHIQDNNTPEIWQREVEQLDVEGDERQDFLRLIRALRGGSKEELQSSLDEAAESPKLSRLAFLRELRTYTQ